MQNLKTPFGQRIKALRKKTGHTQESFAECCHVSVETISNIERGIHGPRFELLQTLSNTLQLPVKALFDF